MAGPTRAVVANKWASGLLGAFAHVPNRVQQAHESCAVLNGLRLGWIEQGLRQHGQRSE